MNHLAADNRSSLLPRVTIDREALQANWRTLAQLNRTGRTGAAVKADGYGLGAVPVALALAEAGCRDFFTAWAEEGAELRLALDGAGIGEARIYVLQGVDLAVVPLCLEARLTPVLSTLAQIAAWGEGLERACRRAPAALQFETGMNRLGLDESALPIIEAAMHGALDVSMVMSHLASADEDRDQTDRQRARFASIAARFPGAERSLANSAASFLGEGFTLDLTRPGIALYGGRAGPQSDGHLAPVATLSAAVLQIREAKAGDRAGYGGSAHLDRPTRIATVGLGYADGYLRGLSGAGVQMRDAAPGPHAFVAGHRVPILGRISMDLTLLDVTDLPEDAIQPGDRAEFFGPNIALDEVAAAAGTIGYELLTGLGQRVRRSWA
ncbi:MAG: alanine racemase [Fulvimarina manganoxydans]|uniref:alanine racemase n=1 Tax=Fulvimarina manganoxydans TaxID=937218 RepID=UPI0023532CAC|nr:alanine racemase [Fulvimarina manganoxydans]MCK5930728.1 alanine racemase [Fulvimarina manganoxydans]